MSSALASVSPKKMMLIVGGMFVVPALLLGGYVALKQRANSEVTGSIKLADSREFTAFRCGSGILSKDAPSSSVQFHGVDIFSKDAPGIRVRAIEDAEKGMVVTLLDGQAAPITIDASACKRFSVRLKETDEMIIDHWGMEGTLQLDCPELVADVRFASCYDGS